MAQSAPLTCAKAPRTGPPRQGTVIRRVADSVHSRLGSRSKTKTRVLFVHHGSGTGGAPLSLIYLIREMDRARYAPFVACHSREDTARELFRSEGLETYDCDVERFTHTCAGWWHLYSPRGCYQQLRWLYAALRTSYRSIRRLVVELRPDVVHLNSLTLLPYARVVRQAGAAVVLHVREPAARGTFGVRHAWLRRLARTAVDAIIYICEDNRQRLTSDIPRSRVIYNFVDFTVFDRRIDPLKAREAFGLSAAHKVALFPGGSSSGIKGVFPLLHALKHLREQFPTLVCLMPGSMRKEERPAGGLRRLLGEKTVSERVEALIDQLDVSEMLRRSEFDYHIERLYAACDVVLVPFVEPHFARPVIEAGAMARPVVASRIGGVSEVVDHGETGLLIEPGNIAELADAMARILSDPHLAGQLGEKGYEQARRRFDASRNAAAILQVYKQLSRPLKHTLRG